MKHTLVIGGTGMLSDVSIWLAEQGDHVSVIGRNHEKMQSLASRFTNKDHLTPMLVDYTKTNELAEKLRRIQEKHGDIERVVAWIHSNGENVIPCLQESLSRETEWDLFHINGSRSNLEEIKQKLKILPNMNYFQIQLGFILEKDDSRWLTNEEISTGIIEAIKKKDAKYLVGTLEPWDKRP